MKQFSAIQTLKKRAAQASIAQIIEGTLGIIYGCLWKWTNRLLGRKIYGGAWLRIYGKAYFRGKGTLYLGSGIVLNGTAIRQVSLGTLSPDATIRIDDNATLSGTAICCQQLVHIHRDTIAADAYIVDTQAHHLTANRRDPNLPSPLAAPVIIHANAWLSTSVVVLKGVNIGENSIVAACSLVRSDIPANVIAAGNPCQTIKALPNIKRE